MKIKWDNKEAVQILKSFLAIEVNVFVIIQHNIMVHVQARKFTLVSYDRAGIKKP